MPRDGVLGHSWELLERCASKVVTQTSLTHVTRRHELCGAIDDHSNTDTQQDLTRDDTPHVATLLVRGPTRGTLVVRGGDTSEARGLRARAGGAVAPCPPSCVTYLLTSCARCVRRRSRVAPHGREAGVLTRGTAGIRIRPRSSSKRSRTRRAPAETRPAARLSLRGGRGGRGEQPGAAAAVFHVLRGLG